VPEGLHVTLTTLLRDRALFPPLLVETRGAAVRDGSSCILRGAEWRLFGMPRRRWPLHSVVHAPGVAEKIVEDVREFLGKREWYADRGGYHHA